MSCPSCHIATGRAGIAAPAVEVPRNEGQAGAVERNVLSLLGRPNDLVKINVLPVGTNRYRVNVIRAIEVPGLLYPSNRITESFYLLVSASGEILPGGDPIEKKYK